VIALVVTRHANGRTVAVAHAGTRPSKAGQLTLSVALPASLRKLRLSRAVKLRITMTFRAQGGGLATVTRDVTAARTKA
jgi:hypothetical protein